MNYTSNQIPLGAAIPSSRTSDAGYSAANAAEQASRNIGAAVSAFSRGARGLAAAYIQTAQIELKEAYEKTYAFVTELSAVVSGEITPTIPQAAPAGENSDPEPTPPPVPSPLPNKRPYTKRSASWGKKKTAGAGSSRKGIKLPESVRKKIAAAAKARKRDKSGHFIPAKKKATTKKK